MHMLVVVKFLSRLGFEQKCKFCKVHFSYLEI